MGLLDQAIEKLVPQEKVANFLEDNYTMEQIQIMVQFDDMRTIEKIINPEKMGLVQFGYFVKDDQGKPVPKQLKNRLFVSRSLWNSSLLNMVTKVEYEVVERFSFHMGQSLRRMVIVEEKKRRISAEEIGTLFEEHKRRTLFSVSQGGKQINKRFSVQGFKLCQHILMDIPDLSPKIYYNVQHLSWIFNTDLYKTDFIIPYSEKYLTLPKRERFYRYLSMVPLSEDEVSYEELQPSDSPGVSSRREREHYINTLLEKRYGTSPEEKERIDNTLYSLITKPIQISVIKRDKG